MFDIKNDDIRAEKSRYAEFLLIVGGIIGSLGLKFSPDNPPALYSLLERIIGMLGLKFLSNDMVNILTNMAFVIFLIVTIAYYSILSNSRYNRLNLQQDFKKRQLVICFLSFVCSIGFSTVIIFQFKSFNLYTDLISGCLFLLLSIVIFVSLYM